MDAPEQAGSPAPAPEQSQGGGAAKLVSQIHSSLMQLVDLVSQSPAADDDDKAKAAAVVQAFQELVEGLGAPAGQKDSGGAPGGVVPNETGAADVKPAY